tara:strand:+ start:1081 stop:1269 length:189 start_codon:yes stop_codon:yes gene_type:complete
MKKKEIKKMTESEMLKNLESFKKDLFNLRFQKNNGQLKNPAKFKETRKNIARLNTIMKGKNA